MDEFDNNLTNCNLKLIIEAIKFERDHHSRYIIIGTKNVEKYNIKSFEKFSLYKEKAQIKQAA